MGGKEIIVHKGIGTMVLMDSYDEKNKISTFKCYQDSRPVTVSRLWQLICLLSCQVQNSGI